MNELIETLTYDALKTKKFYDWINKSKFNVNSAIYFDLDKDIIVTINS